MNIRRAKEVFPGDSIYEVFDLDPETGYLYWAKDVNSRARKGQRAGCLKSNGYRYIIFSGMKFFEHYIVFRMVEGYWPENDLDHINGIRDDNRPENLREVSKSCNMQNCKI